MTQGRNRFQTMMSRYGAQSELARRIPCTSQAVNIWAKKGRPPRARVKRVSELLGIPRHELEPHIAHPDQHPTLPALER